ncbi:DNA-binding protein [Staphylococcus chromogenes]|uniref:DNA-binding protein n=1 Tax=Staphylococcus chromogenes TaxID=46126 RepID=UPI000D1B87C6|nr:DNA-binding protein [Staphylococcus chromogenes]MDT0693205.1 DNA-binding protein [Staphylococcus chromogenes]MDT0700767.1 DNA-binding protein [Staphylococcus chromogenes]MDU0451468.1 DNA-binding protein [Staphylococcus chromogenes]PTG09241.1 DNA-binding protein [Staphylococcus chromogenes]PTG17175.1 DNA-binding protein [Staphylococcus chromogenes]
MLTKEFALKSKLSEKQVRKIVQHLEERGYQLKKTEYRGREATDFQEEDIELFQEIAERVGRTNSYELAFEELEKEKDFLQVIVKENPDNLPSDQQFPQVMQELKAEINKMREERQLLGQMISQVHQQQEELKALHNQLNNQLETNTKSLNAMTEHQKLQAEQLTKTQESIETQTKEQKELATTIKNSHQQKGFWARLLGG